MKKNSKKLVLPLILLLNCTICVFFFPPSHLLFVVGIALCLVLAVFFLVKFFLPTKYAFLASIFLGVYLILSYLRLLDIINGLLLVSLAVGSIILIK